MSNKHSLFSASGASRWAACPGSLVLNEGKPNTTNKYAAEGTACHELADLTLRHDTKDVVIVANEHYKDCKTTVEGFEIEFTNDHFECVQGYVDYVLALGGAVLTEVRLNYAEDIKAPLEEAYGTSDAVVVNTEAKHVDVVDLKMGRKYVEADGNKQFALYGIGVLRALQELMGTEIETISLHTYQPRLSMDGFKVTYTVPELEEIVAELQTSVLAYYDAKAYAQDHGTNPDWYRKYTEAGPEQCQYCASNQSCPTLRASVDEALEPVAYEDGSSFTVTEAPAVIDDGDLFEMYRKIPTIEHWISAVKEEMGRRMLVEGRSIPGMKIIAGRPGNRVWASEEKVFEWADENLISRDRITTSSLLSPAGVDKVLKAMKLHKELNVDSLVTRSSPKPTLALEEEPGEPWSSSDANDFEVSQ